MSCKLLSFPSTLKTLRLEKEMTQCELARELGISRGCLANYETGKREPDQQTMINIAEKFNVLTDYLVGTTNIRQIGLNEDNLEKFKIIYENISKINVLDVDDMSNESKIALLEFYQYLKERDDKRNHDI